MNDEIEWILSQLRLDYHQKTEVLELLQEAYAAGHREGRRKGYALGLDEGHEYGRRQNDCDCDY